MWLQIDMSAQSPLAFRDGRDQERNKTLPYVPGPSLMGGLAYAHQILHPAKTDEFASFFLQERVRFSNCYPADFQSDDLADDAAPVKPLPTTMRSCKRFGGFRFNADQEDEDRRGVTDALGRLALFAMSGETRPDILEPLALHPNSNQPFDAVRGFFRQDGYNPKNIGKAQDKQILRTHTGINYKTETVSASILYSRQALPRGSKFWGQWWVDDKLADSFMKFAHASQELLRVGTGRTRGLGQVQFNATPVEKTTEDLQKRVDRFSEGFKSEAKQANVDVLNALYVPLLCASDMILHDRLMRNRLQIDGQDLQCVGIEDAQQIFHAAHVTQLQGWSGLWGLPKADEWAIGMGSVFLLKLPSLDQATYEALGRLEDQGLGARRTEGFGTVSVADPIHIELMGDRLL